MSLADRWKHDDNRVLLPEPEEVKKMQLVFAHAIEPVNKRTQAEGIPSPDPEEWVEEGDDEMEEVRRAGQLREKVDKLLAKAERFGSRQNVPGHPPMYAGAKAAKPAKGEHVPGHPPMHAEAPIDGHEHEDDIEGQEGPKPKVKQRKGVKAPVHPKNKMELGEFEKGMRGFL